MSRANRHRLKDCYSLLLDNPIPSSLANGNRRQFFRSATALATASAAGTGTDLSASAVEQVLSAPAAVFVETDAGSAFQPAQKQGDQFTASHVSLACKRTPAGLALQVNAENNGALSRIILRWPITFSNETLYLGDAWERSYGDLQWRFLQPERIMPWYFAAHTPAKGTFMAGVQTQPHALSCWLVDGQGVSLWLDFRNGGSAAIPGDREIPAATIVSLRAPADEKPFSALGRFCAALCPSPRLAKTPLCGNNNWYYAYGRDFDAAAMLRDAGFLAELTQGANVRPYCVVDAGWTPGSTAPGGPWNRGDPQRFPDMPGLASKMRAMGVKPGIWIRPTALTKVDDPRRLRSGPVNAAEKPLDLTLPENIASVHDDIARMRSWGYELIKHDFSTFDIFGRWGFQMGVEITDAGWHFNDRSLTNAEIVLRLYQTIRNAAADGIVLGCNTIGHLAAGSFEAQRIGDDTSGHDWERTRRMGVNTLAYRLCQNGAFFACDPDCAAHTARTPWELDRQFLDLVAGSGAALFISADPRTTTPQQKQSYRRTLRQALSTTPGHCEPLDWIHTTAPRKWALQNQVKQFEWEPASGVDPRQV